MTLCIQCALKALLAGEPVPTFTESPEAHQSRVHQDAHATMLERLQLERELWARMRETPMQPTNKGGK